MSLSTVPTSVEFPKNSSRSEKNMDSLKEKIVFSNAIETGMQYSRNH